MTVTTTVVDPLDPAASRSGTVYMARQLAASADAIKGVSRRLVRESNALRAGDVWKAKGADNLTQAIDQMARASEMAAHLHIETVYALNAWAAQLDEAIVAEAAAAQPGGAVHPEIARQRTEAQVVKTAHALSAIATRAREEARKVAPLPVRHLTVTTFTDRLLKLTDPKKLAAIQAAGAPGLTVSGSPLVVKIANIAKGIANMKLPYVLGGHTPSMGGMDCSGTVSYIMQQAGFNNPYMTTSSGGPHGNGFAGWGDPGPGGVTIYNKANGPDAHVFLKIGSRYFGTSGFGHPNAANGTGANWFTVQPSASYLAGFAVRHVPGT